MYKMKHLTCLNAADPFPMTLGKKVEPAKAVPRSVLLETERREFETKCFDFSEKVPEQEWEPIPDPDDDIYAKNQARETKLYWVPDKCFEKSMHVSAAAGRQPASEDRYLIDFDVVRKKHLMAIKLGVPPEILRRTYKKLSPLSGGAVTRVSEKDLDKLAHALETLCNDYTTSGVSPSKETLRDFARNFFTNVQDRVSLKKARGVLLMNASAKDGRTSLNAELIDYVPTNRIAGTLMQLKKIHSDTPIPYVCHHVED